MGILYKKHSRGQLYSKDDIKFLASTTKVFFNFQNPAKLSKNFIGCGEYKKL
jgi:hypothetical protein